MFGIGLIIFLLTLAILIGSILGWIAYARTTRLDKTVREIDLKVRGLETRLIRLRAEAATGTPSVAQAPAPPPPKPAPVAATPEHEPPPSQPEQPVRQEPPAPERPRQPPPEPAAAAQAELTPSAYAEPERDFLELLLDNMQRNWMAWLGGVCVALAGIFLVSYGIEMGYVGPRARIAAALIAGLVLHAAAEYFRRKTQTPHPAFAAMAGGASITLYAALYAALELYSMMSPGLAFALLAVVSLLTMALALRHGPVLAVLGILGAYVVPLLVGDSGASALVNLAYSFIVTVAALFLIRFVYRPWLWFGALAGALGWWLHSLGHVDADGLRGLYLAACTYALLAIPSFDWTLSRKTKLPDPSALRIPDDDPRSIELGQLTLALIALAQAASIASLGFTGFGPALLAWSPLVVVMLFALRSRTSLAWIAWVLLLTELGAWLVAGVGNSPAVQHAFLGFAAATAALFTVGTWLARRGREFDHAAAALGSLAPVLWLALCYLLVTDMQVSWRWSVATLIAGLAYMTLAGFRLERSRQDGVSVWLLLAGHFAYSLAVAMAFREATLTLALAAQVVSLTWLGRRFELPALDWVTKGVLAVVVARLTFNPWLATYPSDVHWSLWTYGGAVLCCFTATRLVPEQAEIRRWLEAATLHLLVLFLGAEVRYWLYDGRIFSFELTLKETAINSVLWGALAISYYNRARVSRNLARFYVGCSQILMVLALTAYAFSLLILNPLWSNAPVAATPIGNILLLAYGAPVLVAVAAWRFYDERFRNLAATIAGGGLFVFVSMEIRHLWHGALDLGLGTTNGEVYTYSAAWLVMAIATMLTATAVHSRNGYRAGMGLLLVVIGKIFLIDMSDLEGLLRVASFMGLGLALLGLAWLYQRTAREVE